MDISLSLRYSYTDIYIKYSLTHKLEEIGKMSHRGHFILPYFKSVQKRTMYEKRGVAGDQQLQTTIQQGMHFKQNTEIIFKLTLTTSLAEKINYLLIT